MKMSAARIRSMFRRHNSVEEEVFRLSRNTRQIALGVPVTLSTICPAPATLSPTKTTFKRSTDLHAEGSADRLSRPRP